ncbi:unnamed protein product [Lupinus luteus]|uniref:Uncharacterized protein n=1 Tax=Lupinus luteus TaxID=3873 RepID=A0AAV1Y162_LUPLU
MKGFGDGARPATAFTRSTTSKTSTEGRTKTDSVQVKLLIEGLHEERARRTSGMRQRLLLHQGSDKRKLATLMRGKDQALTSTNMRRDKLAYY